MAERLSRAPLAVGDFGHEFGVMEGARREVGDVRDQDPFEHGYDANPHDHHFRSEVSLDGPRFRRGASCHLWNDAPRRGSESLP